jgi:hypothetical protein
VLAGAVGRDDILRPLPEGGSIEGMVFNGDAVGGGGAAGATSARPSGAMSADGAAAVQADLAALGPVAVVVTGSGIADDVRRTVQTEVVGATGAIGLRAVAPDDVVAGDGTDASMLRLAEAIGAKWMLVVAIGSADARTADAVVGQDRFRAVERSVRGSWRLVAASDAAAIAGNVFEGSARTMVGSGGSDVSVDVTRPLDRDAASEAAADIARSIAAAAATIAVAADGAMAAAGEGHRGGEVERLAGHNLGLMLGVGDDLAIRATTPGDGRGTRERQTRAHDLHKAPARGLGHHGRINRELAFHELLELGGPGVLVERTPVGATGQAAQLGCLGRDLFFTLARWALVEVAHGFVSSSPRGVLVQSCARDSAGVCIINNDRRHSARAGSA